MTYKNPQYKDITHVGVLVKRNSRYEILSQIVVRVIEHNRTWQEVLFWQFYHKTDGRRRPKTAVHPWTLENVMTIDEWQCAKHDAEQAYVDHVNGDPNDNSVSNLEIKR